MNYGNIGVYWKTALGKLLSSFDWPPKANALGRVAKEITAKNVRDVRRQSKVFGEFKSDRMMTSF